MRFLGAPIHVEIVTNTRWIRPPPLKEKASSSGNENKEQIPVALTRNWSSDTESYCSGGQPEMEKPSEEGRRLVLMHVYCSMSKPGVRFSILLFGMYI
jgi:hypothetical protein